VKVVYIAGPFRAASHWAVEQNIRVAEAIALEVWRMGAAALCPHTNARFFSGAAPDEVWLAGDLELLRRCDAVLMVGRWWESSGAREEKVAAGRYGLPAFEDLAGLREWLGV
jgi:Domain of unknown function (DUF4406)